MKEESFRHVYRFGRFELQPEERRLLDAGAPVEIHSRALDVLAILAARPDQLVTKSELLDLAWPNLVVEENNLHVQISALRKVLGVDAIATVAGRGYRFAWPVDRVTTGAGALVYQRHNLPTQATTFVGRTRELDEAKALLGHARLLTVTGPGGVGKTRFALRLAGDMRATYPDGVWLVELAPLEYGALVRPAVAQALGVGEHALAAHVRPLQLLLVLDNCEHLIEAAAKAADELLAAGEGITIIATSREPLRVIGEHCLLLPSLSLPGENADAADVARSDAAALFVDRARAQRPDFAVDDGDAGVMAELCRRLDGMPLALELAAARVSQLSLGEINARLADRFGFLSRGVRTALPRQRTLRATIDWSHDLLDERERALLRRLSVFAGSFSVDAVEHVAADDGAQLSEVLFRLVACSLVLADPSGAYTRYRLLETTRVYAAGRLAEAGEAATMRQRHLAYFTASTQDASREWLTLPDPEWEGKYRPDHDNVRAAVDWAFGEGDDARSGISLVSFLGTLNGVAGRDETLRACRIAVSRIDADTPVLDQAGLWLHLGTATRASETDDGMAAFDRAIDLYRGLDDPFGLGNALDQRAVRTTYQGRLEDAKRDFEEAGLHMARSGFAKAQALHLHGLGQFKAEAGDLAGARHDLELALATFVTFRAERRIYSVRNTLAEIDWRRGDLDAALTGFRDNIVAIRSSMRPPMHTLGHSVQALVGVLVDRNDFDEALALARRERKLIATTERAPPALDYLALRLAMLDRIHDAARVAGRMDRAHRDTRVRRDHHQQRARDRAQELLQAALAPGDLARLLQEGEAFSTIEAVDLALA